MFTLNYKYKRKEDLEDFILKNKIKNSNNLLIQIFYSKNRIENILEIKEFLENSFYNSAIIGASTSGIISDGKITYSDIIISFSIFEASNTLSKGYKNQSIDNILIDLSKNVIQENTKLLIVITKNFSFDYSTLLKKLNVRFPNIVIAGGNTGDYSSKEQTNLFSNNHDDCDLIFASVNSNILDVQTNYLFNWESIGEEMTITKINKSTVYTIDNKRAIDVYREYLGDTLADDLIKYGAEFPLIYEENKVLIARALINCNEENGSITFAGEIPKNKKVKFGFANIDSIKELNKQNISRKYEHKQESIFIYSCSARKQMLGTFFKKEINMLNNLGISNGLIVNGEFFHDKQNSTNNLLNISTTFVTLNENIINEKLKFENDDILTSKKDIKLNALTNLIKKTSEKLDENNYYLKQFKNIVNESSIYSTTNQLGEITHINKNFQEISGYKKDELIGKNHNIIKHPDTPLKKHEELWETIQSGQIWHGLIKNQRKNGSVYYLLSDIAPIYYKNGEFREYVGIKHNVTELEEYKQLLKYELDSTSKTLKDNLNYTKQYENAVNASVAIMKIGINGLITYVNEKFLNLSEYEESEILGKKWDELLSLKHKNNGDNTKIFNQLEKGKTVNTILTKKTKNGKTFITRSIFYPIIKKGRILEYLNVLNDLTDIFKLNEEIINTQKEVVFTMGAIGETRSQETGLHVKRVAEYSYLLAILSGLSEKEANLLKQASPMHDIGKVGIPDNILNKPGKLTPEEFEIMKSHAQLGYEMLKHSKRDILKASALVAREHHEKWDGSGYPRALSGEDIHIYGRITAIADVFDALGHDRIYKKAWPLEDIFKLLNEEKGKHFDPNLIDIFFNNLDKFLEIKEHLND
jgi:PAS domain S-box-containing protein